MLESHLFASKSCSIRVRVFFLSFVIVIEIEVSKEFMFIFDTYYKDSKIYG
jgi:hypothetical protein